MASPKVKLEGKKIAEKVMEFMDNYSFGPVYEGIKEDGTTPISARYCAASLQEE